MFQHQMIVILCFEIHKNINYARKKFMLFVIMYIITKIILELEINKTKTIKNLFFELGKSIKLT